MLAKLNCDRFRVPSANDAHKLGRCTVWMTFGEAFDIAEFANATTVRL